MAARYDEDRARYSFASDDVVASLPAAAWVVDLGCGTGRWLEAQRSAVPGAAAADVTFVGVDPSAAMLGEAAAKGLGALVRARAEALPFRDGTIAYVVAKFSFHHFVDKPLALDEIARVLSPPGVFRVANIEPSAASGWWVYDFFPDAVAVDAARFWPPDRLASALEARGFAVSSSVESGTTSIPAAQALADAERRVISQLAALDDDAYARGLARLGAVAADPDATVTTSRARLDLTARRQGAPA